jgi:tRNA 2-thiouridine synthesizing protein A
MATSGLSKIIAARVIDTRGAACSGPVLEAKKGMCAIIVGEVLEIWSDDPNTKRDVPEWVQKVGHEYLGYIAAEGYDRIFVKRLK